MNIWKEWVALFEDESPDEPRFDPVHLGAVLVGTQVAAGALFWLLWSLLVYEGGVTAGLRVANACALAAGVAVLAALHRAFFRK